MRLLHKGSFLLSIALLLSGPGCASFAASGPTGAGHSRDASQRMDQARLEEIFSDQVEAITGPSGAIQTQVDGIPVYCISDPENDRMRLIAPVARVTGLDPRVHEILLRANFYTTLDARYAISEDYIFASYLHPISSLTPEQIESALAQVVSLVKTFGTTFSGGEPMLPNSTEAQDDAEGEAGARGTP